MPGVCPGGCLSFDLTGTLIAVIEGPKIFTVHDRDLYFYFLLFSSVEGQDLTMVTLSNYGHVTLNEMVKQRINSEV